MAHTLKEKKVLKKLGIEDFRHMTKDKVVQFVSMLPQMDPEVAKTALEQFPEFKNLGIEVVKNIRELGMEVIGSDERSYDRFCDLCDKVTDSLDRELGRDDLTPEQEREIREDLMRIVEMVYEKDTQRKEFILKIVKSTCSSAVAIALIAAALLGVDVKGIGRRD